MSETIKVRSDTINEDSKNVLRRILLIVKPYWGLLALSVALNLLASIFDNLITFLHQKITDQAILPGDIDMLWHFIALLVGVMIILAVANLLFVQQDLHLTDAQLLPRLDCRAACHRCDPRLPETQ